MLSDIERKVLRVIANYSAGRRRTPKVDELCIKTGRNRGGIMTDSGSPGERGIHRVAAIGTGQNDCLGSMGKKGAGSMASKIESIFAASRWVLPEQRALYLQTKEDEKLIPHPVLEQDELESFHYKIRDAGREDYAITVTWWKSVKGGLGTTCSMWGTVKWIDKQGRRIKLVNDEETQWIGMDIITSVKV